jgi:SAM-dependent methyltransferase
MAAETVAQAGPGTTHFRPTAEGPSQSTRLGQLGDSVFHRVRGAYCAVTSLVERVLGSPALYDAVQRAAGLEKLRRRLCPILRQLDSGTLLDVGAGTGSFYGLVPPHVKYVPLDVDSRKLDRLREKHQDIVGVVASATALPFDDASFDYTLCTNVAHHLSDADLDRLVAELARVTRRQLVFVDPLRVNGLASRVLWSIDRGSYPRSYEALVANLTSRFASQQLETFAVVHTYVLFVGSRCAPEDASSPAST